MHEVQEKISNLPARQQLALWVILRMDNADKKDIGFLSSKFAKKFKRYVSEDVKKDSEDYGRFVGGVLSGLYRNSFLKRISGGRDKLWVLSDDVNKNFEEYQKRLFVVKTYWSLLK